MSNFSLSVFDEKSAKNQTGYSALIGAVNEEKLPRVELGTPVFCIEWS